MSASSARWADLKASADFLGNGAIEINRYETEIYDKVRRNSVFLQRVDRKPATGHPHRYFEELSIGTASFTDPRNIAPTPSGPDRVERAAMIKAIVAQTNLSLFDVDVTRQQGQFAYLEAKDIDDITNAVIVGSASAVWNGSDTSLVNPTTTQYVSVLTQVSGSQFVSQIAPGASIIDGLKSQVAKMVASPGYVIRPTAIYIDPILGDYIDREAKAGQITLAQVEVTVGVKVNAIMTQAGPLPLIADPFMSNAITPASTSAYGFSSTPSGFKGYNAVIVSEKDIEMAVIHGGDGNLMPRVFQLGLLAGLQGQYVSVLFDNVIVKGATYSHALVQVQRP